MRVFVKKSFVNRGRFKEENKNVTLKVMDVNYSMNGSPLSSGESFRNGARVRNFWMGRADKYPEVFSVKDMTYDKDSSGVVDIYIDFVITNERKFDTLLRQFSKYAQYIWVRGQKGRNEVDINSTKRTLESFKVRAKREEYDDYDDEYGVETLPISFTIPSKDLVLNDEDPDDLIQDTIDEVARDYGVEAGVFEEQGRKYFVEVTGDEEQIDDFIYYFRSALRNYFPSSDVFGVDY